jgi:predicted glycoside hydrolase/deacetylase ChbG (UPF0249 family)
MAKLIFNADDLGLSRGVNRGILECYKNGIVNSASLMTTTPYFEETVFLIKENKLTNIGLHFNLTEGKPLLISHKTMVDKAGNFMRNICDEENVVLLEVEQELEAQLKKAIDAGVLITHLDSHHHIHMSANVSNAFLKIAHRYNLPLRKIENNYRHPIKRMKHYMQFKKHQFYTDSFSSDFYGEEATVETLNSIIKNAKGSIEIMCHPGYQEEENGIYDVERKKELDILTSDAIKKLVLR